MRGGVKTGGVLRQRLPGPPLPGGGRGRQGQPSPPPAGVVMSFAGWPGGLASAPDGTMWVSALSPAAIWRVTAGGAVSRVETAGADGAPLAPAGLAVTGDGTLLVADRSGHRVCTLEADGSAQVLAGGTSGDAEGRGRRAQFRNPTGVAVAGGGACYVADTGNDRIRRVGPDGEVTTVAGSIYDYGDGWGAHARFRRPGALAAAGDGDCYVADTGNNALRRVGRDGRVTTLAGGPPGGGADSDGRPAGLRWPSGVALGAGGTVLVADHGNRAVRSVDPGTGSATTVWRSDSLWPVAVAAGPGDALAVLAVAWAGDRRPRACLMVVPLLRLPA